MYNRYIPAEDGTYRRQVVEERRKPPAPVPAPPKPPARTPPPPPPPAQPVKVFGMDAADLILLAILLLILLDSGTDHMTLLLTAVLYFLLQ